MPARRFELDAERSATGARNRLAEDLRRLCDDAGIGASALARSSGLSKGFVARVLGGDAKPSLETYGKLATVLGADLSSRLYPNTGPVIRDRHQARILEGMLKQIHPRWHVSTEVAIRQPARGWIDVALHDPRERVIVASEIQSELRRLEQMIRWGHEKAESLPSWVGWARLAEAPNISQLLVVRRTRATRQVAREFARQLAVAYPAHPDDAVAALTGLTAWPGPALVWALIESDRVRLLSDR